MIFGLNKNIELLPTKYLLSEKLPTVSYILPNIYPQVFAYKMVPWPTNSYLFKIATKSYLFKANRIKAKRYQLKVTHSQMSEDKTLTFANSISSKPPCWWKIHKKLPTKNHPLKGTNWKTQSYPLNIIHRNQPTESWSLKITNY